MYFRESRENAKRAIRPKNNTTNTNRTVYVYAKKYVYKRLPNSVQYVPRIDKIYDATKPRRIPKVVVFDLDETIGCFSDLYLIWNAIFTKNIYRGEKSRPIIQRLFNDLLDLYPEFLRYGILNILRFIKTKIGSGESHRIYLYTNNQCDFSVWTNTCVCSPTEWVEMIIVYLNIRLGVVDTIFAKPLCAFKINQQVIEPMREGHRKSHRDFLKCSVLPKTTEICFVDDNYYEKMIHDKVYYIQPPPYFHNLTRAVIIDRFVSSKLHSDISRDNISREWMSREMETCTPYPFVKSVPSVAEAKDSENHEIYQKMMYYIKEFFCITVSSHVHTHRNKPRLGKFTRKRGSKPST